MANLEQNAGRIPLSIKGAPAPALSTGQLVTAFPSDLTLYLDDFRRDYESIHGPTDSLTPYTSQLPQSVQDWLIENDPERYFSGLPPFVLEYFTELARNKSAVGQLDDLPPCVIELFLRNRGKLTEIQD